jgi:hypothetical protein
MVTFMLGAYWVLCMGWGVLLFTVLGGFFGVVGQVAVWFVGWGFGVFLVCGVNGSSNCWLFVYLGCVFLHVCLMFNFFSTHTVNFIRDGDDKHCNIEGKKWPLTKQK